MKSPWIRRLLIGAGALVLLIAAVLTYLVSTFDPNAYKGLAIDWMKTNRDRTLAIDGPIELSVFPRLAVKVSGVRLSEKGRADEFMALQEAGLSVAVMPLLRRQVVVDSVRARGLRVNYVRDAKGVSNIDDLTSPSTPAKPETAPGAPAEKSAAIRFDVSRIELDDLRLKLRDDQSKLAGDVTVKSLSTGRLADGVESPIKLEAQLALTSPVVRGDLTADTKLSLDTATQALSLGDLQLQWKGDLPGAQAVSAKLATKRFAYDPANQALQLSKLQLKVDGNSSGHPLKLDLDWPELSVKGESLSGSGFSGKASLQGPNAIDADFKTAAPSGNFQRIVLPNVETTIKGRSGPRQVAGTVRATLQIDAARKQLTLDGLNTQLQLQEPSLQPLTIAIQGKADASADAAHWALKGNINTNPFTSDGSALLSTKPLTLNVVARFDSLDLNRLLPASAGAQTASAPTNTGPAPDKPVDLAVLKSIQGKFDVRVGRFAYQTYRVADAVFTATLENGLLRVSQLSGKAWGGSLDATASADARSNRVAVKANASNVNVNALLKDVAKKDVLEGTGRVVLDVDTAGQTVNQMKSHLKGSAALQLRDGAVKGVNLAKSARQAKATLGMKQGDDQQKANQTEKTDFSELSASFAIAEGVARSTDLDAKSPYLRLAGDGALDIGKGVIDYNARATVTDTSKGQGGGELATLNGLTIPVHLTGPFEAMDWRIRWSAVAKQALKTEVGNQVKDKLRDKLGLPSGESAASGTNSSDAARRAAEDKLKDKLKGIFK